MVSRDNISIETSDERKRRLIAEDMQMIDEALYFTNYDEIKNVHMLIDGKYQACIRDWMKGMEGGRPVRGFSYHHLDIDALKTNLKIMQAKLDMYKEGWNASVVEGVAKSDLNVIVNNNNTINISISFAEARQKIEDMAGLTDDDTEEIKEKIDELEVISKEGISKKKKWEKIKPILAFVLDKGADVAITIMGLVLQMELGM